MSFIQYYLRVLSIAFSGASAIFNVVSAILPILGGIYVWKRPPKEPIVKNLLWIIPLGLFITSLIITIAIAPYRIYQKDVNDLQTNLITAQKKIDEYEQNIPKFELRLANVQFLSDSDKKVFMFVEMEIRNLGSPSVVKEWQAELKLGSQRIGTAIPITMNEGREFWSKEHLIAKFVLENSLMDKVAEEPLAKGAAKAGWLIFEFTNITEDQFINAEKIIYVEDYLMHEYSYKFEDIGKMPSLIRDTHSYIPGTGPMPFKQ